MGLLASFDFPKRDHMRNQLNALSLFQLMLLHGRLAGGAIDLTIWGLFVVDKTIILTVGSTCFYSNLVTNLHFSRL